MKMSDLPPDVQLALLQRAELNAGRVLAFDPEAPTSDFVPRQMPAASHHAGWWMLGMALAAMALWASAAYGLPF